MRLIKRRQRIRSVYRKYNLTCLKRKRTREGVNQTRRTADQRMGRGIQGFLLRWDVHFNHTCAWNMQGVGNMYFNDFMINSVLACTYYLMICTLMQLCSVKDLSKRKTATADIPCSYYMTVKIFSFVLQWEPIIVLYFVNLTCSHWWPTCRGDSRL